MKKHLVILLAGLLSLACSLLDMTAGPLPTPDGKWHCGPLPENFQESNLVGTWKSSRGETIILREDGTYKQMIQTLGYESPWNHWRIEHQPSGGVYVHLEKMRFCTGFGECERPEGGSGSTPLWNPCEHRRITVPGEVMLAVARDNYFGPRGSAPGNDVILLHMGNSDGICGGWFTRQE